MLAGVTDCRRSRKWGRRGRLVWDLIPGSAAIPGRKDHIALAEWGPHGGNPADGAGSLTHGLLLFLRYGTLDLGRGGRKDCVRLWVF